MRSSCSLPTRLAGVVCVAFSACAQATVPAPASAVFGHWSRTPDGCRRPEFQLNATDVVLLSDGDGAPVTFDFRQVEWTADTQGQVTVELNQPHPYGKAPSKTALTFKPVGADDIELVLRTHPVPLHRCPMR